MIKIRMKNNLIFGLSDINLTKLKEGKPIKFNLKDLDMDDVEVIIFHGKDEDIMQEMFKDMIHPELTKYEDKRPKQN